MTDVRTILFIDDVYCHPPLQSKLLEKFGVVIKDLKLTPTFTTAEDTRLGHSVREALRVVDQIQNLVLAVVDLEFEGQGPLGVDIIHSIRRLKRDLPLICFSSKRRMESDYEQVEQALRKAGASAFLNKGLSANDIAKEVKKIMRPLLGASAPASSSHKRIKAAATAHAK